MVELSFFIFTPNTPKFNCMKSAEEWFNAYGVSHKNKTNKLIHWICVPLIFFTLLGLLSEIPAGGLKSFFPENIQPFIHYGTVVVIIGLLFYARLSASLTFGMFLFSGLNLWIISLLNQAGIHVGYLSLTIFVLAWIGQFIGHKIEGAKPSFFEDLQFLLIGPIWLLQFIYKKVGISI